MSRLPLIGVIACTKQIGQHLSPVAGKSAVRAAVPAAPGAMGSPDAFKHFRAPSVFIKATPASSVSFLHAGAQQEFLKAPVAARTLCINSLHGQGVVRLAPGLRVEALAPDGLITAFTAAVAKSWAFHPPVTARQSAFPRGLAGFR